jgi:hypothetical protein
MKMIKLEQMSGAPIYVASHYVVSVRRWGNPEVDLKIEVQLSTGVVIQAFGTAEDIAKQVDTAQD